MSNLEAIVGELMQADLHGQLWVDGSFMTSKNDPADVDIVLHAYEGQGFTIHDPSHRAAIQWLQSNLKTSHGCDSYVNLIPPVVHLAYDQAMSRISYWARQFGLSRGGITKGIAVVAL